MNVLWCELVVGGITMLPTGGALAGTLPHCSSRDSRDAKASLTEIKCRGSKVDPSNRRFRLGFSGNGPDRRGLAPLAAGSQFVVARALYCIFMNGVKR